MKIVRESIVEGVADKAAEKMFNIPDPDLKFKEKETAKKVKEEEEIVAKVYGYNNKVAGVVKNPKDISNIALNARGVIDKDGNLYIETKSTVTHQTLVDELIGVGLLPDKKIDWWLMNPEVTGYITVQRSEFDNTIYLGESNILLKRVGEPFYNKTYSKPDKYFPIYKKFLDKAENKNPKFNFVNLIKPEH
jgi:hypothetical protein